jgi:inhibitor of cysteine peptidase
VGAVAAVALFAAACTAAAGPQQEKMAVGYDEFMQQKQITKQVTISKGAELIIDLAANPSTGFSWGEATVADPDTMQQKESRYVAPAGGAPGAAGSQVWTFTAAEKGTTTVKMQYSRPWEGGEQAEWTFEIAVTVQ